jgi:glutamate-1-semialdehyde 2,1-aminomutase
MTASPVMRTVDRDAVARLTRREQARLNAASPASGRLYRRACGALSGGVTSSFQARAPWPIYLRRGAGSRVWDVDGVERSDFHNAFGSMLQGHAHPAITAAVAARCAEGTHFAAPTEEAVAVAELLAARWSLAHWRFVNSGTEATMDAIRIARALTGREVVVKIFGSFHGHHDAVLVSVAADPFQVAGAGLPPSIPHGAGIPEATLGDVATVHYNDVDGLERRIEQLARAGRPAACVIIEPAMLNLGVVLPRPGYLEAVRELTTRHGIVLIFDEVKTGFSLGPGGATRRFGVTPDLVTLAKALSAGLPAAAIGGAEAMGAVADGSVFLSGTFNGNPLVMAAAYANLTQVLTPGAHDRLEALNARLLEACRAVLDAYDLPGYAVGAGAKGCVTFAAEEVVDFPSYQAHQDAELTELAWLYAMNRGIFMTPGREEEWTLSVAHDETDVDRYAAVLAQLAEELSRS